MYWAEDYSKKSIPYEYQFFSLESNTVLLIKNMLKRKVVIFSHNGTCKGTCINPIFIKSIFKKCLSALSAFNF